MVKEAGEHADEDKRRREEIESRNTADSRVYQVEKLLEENKDKVGQEDERSIRAAIEEVRKAMNGGSKDAIDTALKELDRASHRLAEHLYKTGAPGATGGPSGDGGAPSDGGAPGEGASGESKKQGDVIDAEYVDVDEGKR
jgi:molecular chaperone DnaK